MKEVYSGKRKFEKNLNQPWAKVNMKQYSGTPKLEGWGLKPPIFLIMCVVKIKAFDPTRK